MADYAISNVPRRVVYAASGVGPYAFTFEILVNTDVAIYKDDALLTLSTDYTVSIAANGTGTVTLTALPTGATQIAIVGSRAIQRTSDFVTGGDFFANTVNDELDSLTIFAQQNAEGLARALQAPQTDPLGIDMTLPRASVRANKTLAFDNNGNPVTGEVVGDNRGNWAAGIAYNKRDIAKDTSNGNVYYVNTAHTSSGVLPISTNADAGKWDLLVDNASAGASAAAAAASETAAAGSASAASTSATNAASSASAAATSASGAATSATNAAASATSASGSATTASSAATSASASASAASASATNAANSETAAGTSATSASGSATAAAASETAAAASASSAATSASTATTQASNASTSATSAASSATAAATSATSAMASLDSFRGQYYGPAASDPAVDPLGNAPTAGDLYFNTTTNRLRVYNATTGTWAEGSSGSVAVQNFNGTGSQAAFTLATAPESENNTQVYISGVYQQKDQYSISSATLTFTSAPPAGTNNIEVVTLNTLPLGVTSADLVQYQQAGTGAVPRTVQDRLREVISVQDFGAIGDNTHRPLSGVNSYNGVNTTGWTLAQWQTVFPHVVSLAQTLDWAAIQAAINYASRGEYTRESIYIPDGYYVITTSLQVPSFATIIGQSQAGTIINNQNVAMTEQGQIVNKDPGVFIFVTIENLTLRGGARGININVTGETAGCNFKNVGMDLHTDFNVQVNKLLQTSVWTNCTFADADYGLFVPNWTSNANTFVNCGFLGNKWASVYLRSSETNTFVGCRFEAGGTQGRSTIDVTDTRNLNLIGCYFEATNEVAVAESGSCNSIWIDGCHFTGATRAGQAGWFPYQFVSDGIIQFGNNNWGVIDSNGPARMFSGGINSSVIPGNAGGTIKQLGNTGTQTVYFAHSKHHKHIVSPWVAPTSASWQKDLVVFRKENTDGAVQNMRQLAGKLTISYYGLTGGGFEQRNVREYLVFVRSAGFSNMGASIVLGMNDSAGGQTLTIQQKAGANSNTLVVEAVFSGLDYGIGGMLQWSFEYITGSKTDMDYIEASLA